MLSLVEAFIGFFSRIALFGLSPSRANAGPAESTNEPATRLPKTKLVNFVFISLPSGDLDVAALRMLTTRTGSPRNHANRSVLRPSGAQMM